MDKVFLKKLEIKNFGPIKEDVVNLLDFTYFVGRNNAGKSHYLKAIEVLLASRKIKDDEIRKIQYDKTQPVEIKGYFEGVEHFTRLAERSNHKDAIEAEIKDGQLCIARILDPNDVDSTKFGILKEDGEVYNPRGFNSSLLKVLPDTISIMATADTVDELKNTANTALSKIKKEVLMSFFSELKNRAKDAFSGLDKFLHSDESGERSPDLIDFETRFKEELMGEFSEVVPSIEFNLPDEEVVAKEMKIFLDDGHKSEIEQKGHGLQRAALIAMLRTLAKHGQNYQDRPRPIFLIGEIETFLHPYAQKLLAEALGSLMERYQVVTSTHSPFIISPNTIKGYRRVLKTAEYGTKTIELREPETLDYDLVERHLDRRGNLEALFADRVILIEGKHDEGFYRRLQKLFDIDAPANKFVLFVKTIGKQELRQARKFFRCMAFDDVSIISDLDHLFCNDMKNLLKEESMDPSIVDTMREHIGWDGMKDPALVDILGRVGKKGEPSNMESVIGELKTKRIFVLPKGAPENYYKVPPESKSEWKDINSIDDLIEVDFLKNMLRAVISG